MASYTIPQPPQYPSFQDIMSAETARYAEAMANFQARYGQAVGAAQAGITEAGVVAPEYAELKGLYAPGGQFGESQRIRIEEARKAGLASAYANLAKSGMWAGTTATGAQTGINWAAQKELTNLEDVRYGKYGEALGLAGAAAQAARADKVQAYQALSAIIAGMQPPAVSTVVSPLETAAVSAGVSTYGTYLGALGEQAKLAEQEREYGTVSATEAARLAEQEREYGTVSATEAATLAERKYEVDVQSTATENRLALDKYIADLDAQYKKGLISVQMRDSKRADAELKWKIAFGMGVGYGMYPMPSTTW